MSDSDNSTSAVIDRFLEAYNSGDLVAMREALGDDAVAFVTGPDGNPIRLDGAEMYIAALGAMDLAHVDYSVQLTQPPVMVGADRALIMTEVRARRDDRTLQNFAAHLLRVTDGKIVEMYMVDAKPADSDAFWA
ncbi:MAG: nuclear transport factor 2 family protein [Ilumatobacteraceae bacterium]